VVKHNSQDFSGTVANTAPLKDMKGNYLKHKLWPWFALTAEGCRPFEFKIYNTMRYHPIKLLLQKGMLRPTLQMVESKREHGGPSGLAGIR